MKRKQKLPRRTRRQSSIASGENADMFAKVNDVKKTVHTTEEYTKRPTINLKDSEEKRELFGGMNYYKAEQRVDLEDGSLQQLKVMLGKPEESCINSDSSIIINEPSDTNVNEVTRNLKKAIEDPVLSIGVTKKLSAFENFRNESDSSSMPVILNIFTLPQEPTSHTKHKASNIIRESNFPVTPPCSPPLPNPQHVAQPQDYRCENTTNFPGSNNHSIKQSSKVPKHMSNELTGNRFSTTNTINNGTSAHQARMNQFMYQTNFYVGDQTICQSVSNGNTNQFSQPIAKISTIPHQQKFVSEDLLHKGNNPVSRSGMRKEQYVSKAAETHDLCAYNDSVINNTKRISSSNNKISNIINGGHVEIGKSELKSVETANNVVCFSNGSENNAKQIRISSVSPSVTPTGKSLCIDTESTEENRNGESSVFLSPRDIKVLQLKKRLLEQEAALKKLRKHP